MRKALKKGIKTKKKIIYKLFIEEVIRPKKKKKPYQYNKCFDMASLEIDL